jgi:uncharacterized protein YhfF
MLIQVLHDFDNLRYWYSDHNREEREKWERENSARNAAAMLPLIMKIADSATCAENGGSDNGSTSSS